MPRPPRVRLLRGLVAPVALPCLAALLTAGCGSSTTGSPSPGPGSSTAATSATGAGQPGTTVAPITRQVLGSIPAPMSPGYDEYLMRVIIQPGATLPTHHHPGIQVARVESGELHYTIKSGTAEVARDGGSTPTEQVTGPAEVTLYAGDTVYENETLVHFGQNKGSVPVEVLLAALLKAGQPVSINQDP